MIEGYLNKKHLLYGGAIVFSRGIEYLVLIFAAYFLSKHDYGELELYKKIIEVGSAFVAFGFPVLIISYTKSSDSKTYLFLLSVLFVFFITLVLSIFLILIGWGLLIIPFLFYSIFFTGGIAQSYILVQKGSDYASVYKSIISLLFYGVIFLLIYFFDVSGKAYVYVSYILLPFSLVYLWKEFTKQNIIIYKLKKYWKLFKKLLYSSSTLVMSSFTNLMFLYTDIFLIKLLSTEANKDIAEYSFSLNIASMLILIPMTLIQVDIERLKRDNTLPDKLNKKIISLLILGIITLVLMFHLLTTYLVVDYKNVLLLFLIIIASKAVHCISILYGTMLIVFKLYNTSLIINVVIFLANIFLSYLLYQYFNVYGIAIASLVSLSIRQSIIFYFFKKNIKI